MNKDAVIFDQVLPRVKKPPLHKEYARTVLEQCADVLDRCGVNWWVSAGTLLGIYREGDFITGDYDIDCEMELGDVESIEKEIDKLAPRYRNLYKKDTGEKIQSVWLFPRNTLFDLYLYRRDERGLVSYAHYSDKDIIYPPDLKKTTIRFHGREYPCWEPERYLRYVYGDTWRVPCRIKSVYEHC